MMAGFLYIPFSEQTNNTVQSELHLHHIIFMKHIISKLTETYYKKLPAENRYYSPEDLLESGFPQVLVERIKIELRSKLRQTLTLPENEWANTQKLSDEWNDFTGAAEKEIRLPDSSAKGLIKEVLEECLKLSIQPRMAVPELIFRDDTEINLKTLQKRIPSIVINRHLATALARYMEKKGRKTLTLDQAKKVVEAIDEKLVAGNHPLNWVELLNPLFLIAGPSADPGLLRLFFEDKGKDELAVKFGSLDTDVKDTGIIEIINSAELPEPEGDTEVHPGLFEAKETGDKVRSEDTELTGKSENEIEPEQETEPEEEITNSEESEEKALNEWFYSEEDEEEDEIFPNWKIGEEDEEAEWAELSVTSDEEPGQGADAAPGPEKKEVTEDQEEVNQPAEPKERPEAASGHSDEEEYDEDEPLLNRFMFDDTFVEKTESDDEGREPKTIYDELRLVRKEEPEEKTMSLFDDFADRDEQDMQEEADTSMFLRREEDVQNTPEEEKKRDEKESEPVEPEEQDMDIFGYGEQHGETFDEVDDGDDDNDNDVPMWRSFLQRSDVDDEPSFQFDDEYDDAGEWDEQKLKMNEEPIYDFTQQESEQYANLNNLSEWVGDEKGKFIEELFSNSETAYEKALVNIMAFEDWKSASKYIESEIFNRNRIDVYSEVAVDFTDRLHSYFMEQKS
jgi:hypothetical protein